MIRDILFWQDNSASRLPQGLKLGLNFGRKARGLEPFYRSSTGDPCGPCPIVAIVATSMDSSLTVMQSPVSHHIDSNVLRSVVEHVFMPPKLPQKDPGEQMEQDMNVALCDTLIRAAQDLLQDLPSSVFPLVRMIKMMKLVRRAAMVSFKETELQRTLSEMDVGGTSIQSPISFFAFGSIISIRRICHAYSCPKRRSHRAQAYPGQLRSVRGV